MLENSAANVWCVGMLALPCIRFKGPQLHDANAETRLPGYKRTQKFRKRLSCVYILPP